jgi:mRNA interferase RelE/StbE
MAYEVRLLPRASSTLRLLEAQDYDDIRDALDALSENPLSRESVRLSEPDSYSLRVGDYRILYEVRGDAVLVPAIRIGHRNYFLQ